MAKTAQSEDIEKAEGAPKEGAPRRRRRRRGRRGRGRGQGESTPGAAANGTAEPQENGDTKPRRRRRSRSRSRSRGPEGPASTQLEAARRIAAKQFKIRRLHPQQEQAMQALFDGRDTLAVLPTGFGKSLIYQVPALMLEGPTLVISPLIALMRDQEQSLLKRNVPVVRLDSTLRVKERREALARIEEGGPLIVLTTPETLESGATRPVFQASRPEMLCIDEAHCISEWGHDFRPAYLRIGAERKALEIPRVLALTATATPRVRDDIARRLQLNDPVVVTAPPDRPNLHFEARTVPGQYKFDQAGPLIKRLRRPGIVYCSTKQTVDDVYAALRRARIPVTRYHAGMRVGERTEQQELFMKNGRRGVMVATNAFGMGIDKPDIRFILHFQVPASPEQYIQEAGRAGRDGKESRCILLYDPKDLSIQEYLQERSRPSPSHLKKVAWALAAWVEDGQAVAPKDLALSAGVPQTTCKSLCAQLEEGGLIGLNDDREYEALVDIDTLKAGAKDLADRFEIERRQDSVRLRAVTEYVETEECRAVYIREWFGEEDTTPCGNCDRCVEMGLGKKPGSSRGGRRRGGKKKTSSKKAGRRRSGQKPATAAGDGTQKKRRRRRRRKKE